VIKFFGDKELGYVEVANRVGKGPQTVKNGLKATLNSQKETKTLKTRNLKFYIKLNKNLKFLNPRCQLMVMGIFNLNE
jgi:hypothetical protein